MTMVRKGDVLIFEDGTEFKVDLVEDYLHGDHTTQYVEGASGNRKTYAYIDDGIADSQQGLKGRIIKCLRP